MTACGLASSPAVLAALKARHPAGQEPRSAGRGVLVRDRDGGGRPAARGPRPGRLRRPGSRGSMGGRSPPWPTETFPQGKCL